MTITELDKLGWKSPWHEHFRIIRNGVDQPHNPDKPPLYAENCIAALCEAKGCPQTDSGFKN